MKRRRFMQGAAAVAAVTAIPRLPAAPLRIEHVPPMEFDPRALEMAYRWFTLVDMRDSFFPYAWWYNDIQVHDSIVRYEHFVRTAQESTKQAMIIAESDIGAEARRVIEMAMLDMDMPVHWIGPGQSTEWRFVRDLVPVHRPRDLHDGYMPSPQEVFVVQLPGDPPYEPGLHPWTPLQPFSFPNNFYWANNRVLIGA